jgi:hypothetical protein
LTLRHAPNVRRADESHRFSLYTETQMTGAGAAY